jgi:hypothetical protein
MAGFTSISCSVQDGVGQLELNRPAKSNSISKQMWEELPRGVEWLLEQGARVVRGRRRRAAAARLPSAGQLACCSGAAPIWLVFLAAGGSERRWQELLRRH